MEQVLDGDHTLVFQRTFEYSEPVYEPSDVCTARKMFQDISVVTNLWHINSVVLGTK